MTSPAAVTAREVSARRGRRPVLHAVDLRVAVGEVVAVLGPNGAGKSTLLGVLGGSLAPTSGRVETSGRVATMLQSPGLARRTVRANVELALAWWGVPRGQRGARAAEALELMGAAHLADRAAVALSGGEQRRVHLARAVAIRPDVLLLDEPFAGLDAASHAALCEDSASALRSAAGAVVLVVHDRSEAWAMADRVVVLMAGRVVADGPPQELLDRPPSPEVARFLGYDGELGEGPLTLLTRPAHVQVGPGGDLGGVVERVLPLEDGMRVQVRTPTGTVRGLSRDRSCAVGATVRLSIRGGARYTAAGELVDP